MLHERFEAATLAIESCNHVVCTQSHPRGGTVLLDVGHLECVLGFHLESGGKIGIGRAEANPELSAGTIPRCRLDSNPCASGTRSSAHLAKRATQFGVLFLELFEAGLQLTISRTRLGCLGSLELATELRSQPFDVRLETSAQRIEIVVKFDRIRVRAQREHIGPRFRARRFRARRFRTGRFRLERGAPRRRHEQESCDEEHAEGATSKKYIHEDYLSTRRADIRESIRVTDENGSRLRQKSNSSLQLYLTSRCFWEPNRRSRSRSVTTVTRDDGPIARDGAQRSEVRLWGLFSHFEVSALSQRTERWSLNSFSPRSISSIDRA